MIANTKQLKAALRILKNFIDDGYISNPIRIEASKGILDLRARTQEGVVQICLTATPPDEAVAECFVPAKELWQVCGEIELPTAAFEFKKKKQQFCLNGKALVLYSQIEGDKYSVKGLRGDSLEASFAADTLVGILTFLHLKTRKESNGSYRQLAFSGGQFLTTDGHRIHAQGGLPILATEPKMVGLSIIEVLMRGIRLISAEKVDLAFYPKKSSPGVLLVTMSSATESLTALMKASDCEWIKKADNALLPIDEHSIGVSLHRDHLRALLEQARKMQKTEDPEILFEVGDRFTARVLGEDESKDQVAEVPSVRTFGSGSAAVLVGINYVLDALVGAESIQLIFPNQLESRREPLYITDQVPNRYAYIAPVYARNASSPQALVSVEEVRCVREGRPFPPPVDENRTPDGETQ